MIASQFLLEFKKYFRWKRDEKNEKVYDPETGKPILQFVAIQRRDTKEWAIPGVGFHFQTI